MSENVRRKKAVKKKKRKLAPVRPAPYTEEQYRDAAAYYLSQDELELNGYMSCINDEWIGIDDSTRRMNKDHYGSWGAGITILGDGFITDEQVKNYLENHKEEGSDA